MRSPTPLKRAIFDANLKQRDIAAEVGLSESHLSRIVNGLHCDDRTRAEIARVIGRNVDELWPTTPESAAA